MQTNKQPNNSMNNISQFAGGIGATLFVLVAFAIVYEVISRYLLGSPSIWVEELSLLAQVWATYLGASFVLKEGALLKIELVAERFGYFGKLISAWTGLLVIALVSAIVVILSIESLLESLTHSRASASLLVLPSWVVELSLPVGFSLLFLQSLVEIYILATQGIKDQQA
ncbi:TRAP transporter small permease subunit [Pseudomonas sp. F1_0610]|uniref:TRAP transporter small permease n=1 Tax=Pseudomonas sp. F1_0610 TaxID=3114284 RepID=UPI0039C1104D